MVFIIEMWGMPRSVKVEDRGKNRFLNCGADFWETMLETGKKNGWVPMGTIPFVDSMNDYMEYGAFEPSYEPEPYQYAKMILKKDALLWAEALEKVLSRENYAAASTKKKTAIIKDGMTEEEFDRVADYSRKKMIEFIQFLEAGGFGFARND